MSKCKSIDTGSLNKKFCPLIDRLNAEYKFYNNFQINMQIFS